MIEVKVNFYATLRAIVGQKTVEVDLPPDTTALELWQTFTRVCALSYSMPSNVSSDT